MLSVASRMYDRLTIDLNTISENKKSKNIKTELNTTMYRQCSNISIITIVIPSFIGQ